jgi:hypothetical protein
MSYGPGLFFARLGVVVFSLLALDGCAGYRVGNTSGRDLQGVRSVYVPVARNTSLSPDLQMTVTNAIIRRFNDDGTLEVNQNANADSELDVTITNIQHTAVRSSTSDILVAAEYQLTIQAVATYARPFRWLPRTSPTTPSRSSPKAGEVCRMAGLWRRGKFFDEDIAVRGTQVFHKPICQMFPRKV